VRNSYAVPFIKAKSLSTVWLCFLLAQRCIFMSFAARTGFDKRLYAIQRASSLKASKPVLLPVLRAVKPASVLDVGCGTGTWLVAARHYGAKQITGVDGSEIAEDQLMIPKKDFIKTDLSKPLRLNRRYDLVISTEVGEHIPPAAAHTFVKNLTRHSDIVLFSAAIPYQAVTDLVHTNLHVNEQYPSYWAKLFAKEGFVPIDCVRGYLWDNKEIPMFYAQNIIIYVNRKQINSPVADRLRALEKPILDIVHPRYYEPRSRKTAFVAKFLPEWTHKVIHNLVEKKEARKK